MVENLVLLLKEHVLSHDVHVVLSVGNHGLLLLVLADIHVNHHWLRLLVLLLGWDDLLLVVISLVHLVHRELLVLLHGVYHSCLGVELLMSWLAVVLLLLRDEGWHVKRLVKVCVILAVMPKVWIVIHSAELRLLSVVWLKVGL